MKWKDKLLKTITAELKNDTEWSKHLNELKNDFPDIGIHLAVFSAYILTELLTGNKTIESRFSSNKVTPYGKVQTGDIVLVKKSGGPIVAIFLAGDIESYSNLTPAKLKSLQKKYSRSLGLSEDDEFWYEKANSKYGTLIRIKKILEIAPHRVEKRDRTGWVVIHERKANNIFKPTK